MEVYFIVRAWGPNGEHRGSGHIRSNEPYPEKRFTEKAFGSFGATYPVIRYRTFCGNRAGNPRFGRFSLDRVTCLSCKNGYLREILAAREAAEAAPAAAAIAAEKERRNQLITENAELERRLAGLPPHQHFTET
jgi:hypothetical protein